jgi:hypothetical protein
LTGAFKRIQYFIIAEEEKDDVEYVPGRKSINNGSMSAYGRKICKIRGLNYVKKASKIAFAWADYY